MIGLPVSKEMHYAGTADGEKDRAGRCAMH